MLHKNTKNKSQKRMIGNYLQKNKKTAKNNSLEAKNLHSIDSEDQNNINRNQKKKFYEEKSKHNIKENETDKNSIFNLNKLERNKIKYSVEINHLNLKEKRKEAYSIEKSTPKKLKVIQKKKNIGKNYTEKKDDNQNKNKFCLSNKSREKLLVFLKNLPKKIPLCKFKKFNEKYESFFSKIKKNTIEINEIIRMKNHYKSIIRKKRLLEKQKRETKKEKEPPTLCGVCKKDIDKSKKFGILDCKHIFHFDCATNLFSEQKRCPICHFGPINKVEYSQTK